MSLTPFAQDLDAARGYCRCGCKRKAPILQSKNRDGLKRGDQAPYRAGHYRRFERDYVVDPDSGCWIWQGASGPDGYGSTGRIARDGKKHSHAHRWAYVERHGAIPEGLHIDHLCRNPACVNPDHLEAVTNAENIRRGKNAKLTWETVRHIRASTRDALALAEELGVSRGTVYSVRSYQTWKDDPVATQ